MKIRTVELTVGLFVFAGLAATALLAINVGGARFGSSSAQIVKARFTNASGLKNGSTVRVAGVTIGSVTDVALKQDEMVALITFRINSKMKLDDDTSAAVRSAGLIGEKFISLKPGSSGTALAANAVIVDTESSVDLEDIISRFAFGSVDKK